MFDEVHLLENFKKSVSVQKDLIRISRFEIEEIITAHLRKEGYVKIHSIEINDSSRGLDNIECVVERIIY